MIAEFVGISQEDFIVQDILKVGDEVFRRFGMSAKILGRMIRSILFMEKISW